MKASDLITHVKAELNEKREGWTAEDLLVKLQRSYVTLQNDLPFFIAKETLAIIKDKTDYTLLHIPLKNVSFKMDTLEFEYQTLENFYQDGSNRNYSFDGAKLILTAPDKALSSEVIYRYGKVLVDATSEIELPATYDRALRLLLLSDIHEKPIMSVDYRDMSIHYIKLYEAEIRKLKTSMQLRPRNIKSNYQRI